MNGQNDFQQLLFDIRNHQLRTTAILGDLNETLSKATQQNEIQHSWFRGYIERSMPIRSHYMILVGSLSVLAAFAAAMKIIDRVDLPIPLTTLNEAGKDG